MGISGVLPDGYDDLLGYVKAQVRSARLRAHLAANQELLRLYWTIGRAILDRQQVQPWGTSVLDRLGADLRAEFPEMRGLSRSNLKYMRRFAAAWPDQDFGQRSVGQLPWGHVTVLLDKLDDPGLRDWYAAAAVEGGWTRDVLNHQILNRSHLRVGAAPSNFAERLPAPDSELASQVVKDPYVFDFLDLSSRVDERRLEQALVDHLAKTLIEFGRGFAYVGRQVHFDVDGLDYFVDLLLCADAHERNVRYALSATGSPIAVATYTYETLPPDVRAALPPSDVLASALEATIETSGEQRRVIDLLVAGAHEGGDHLRWDLPNG